MYGRKAISALNFVDNPISDDHDISSTTSLVKKNVYRDKYVSLKARPRFGSLHSDRNPKYAKATLNEDAELLVAGNIKKWKSSLILMEVGLKELIDKAQESRDGFKSVNLIDYCLSILKELESNSTGGEAFIFSSMRTVFENCLYVKSEVDERFRVPYYSLVVNERDIGLLDEMRKAAADYELISESELEKGKLVKSLNDEKREHSDCREELKKLTAVHEKLKEEYASLKKSAEQSYKELKAKLDETEKNNTKLRTEIKFLRSYKEDNEAKKKRYFVLKRFQMKDKKDMHDIQEDMAVLTKLHEQLEMLENRRIEDYSYEIHQAKQVDKSTIKTEFVSDAQLLNNEMMTIHEKVNRLDENTLRIKTKVEDPQKRKNKLAFCVSNDFTSPMMGLDALSLRSSIEVFFSKNDGKFKLAHRSTITPQYTPEVVEVPNGVTHMKLMHSQLHYYKNHPNMQDAVTNPSFEPIPVDCETIDPPEEEEKFTFLKPTLGRVGIATNTQTMSKIWDVYKSRYGNKIITDVTTRKMTLKEVREIILDTYVQYHKDYRQPQKEVRSIDYLLYDVLDQIFVLPEIVHKVSFEFLTACEEFRAKYADILEFCKSMEGLNDPAFGASVSLALHTLRAKWNNYAKDSKSPLKREAVCEILQSIYQEVPTEERETLINDIIMADPVCFESNQYFLSKLNTFFIIAFRDVTEYWTEMGESKVLVKFEKDRLQLEEFVPFMLEIDPNSNKDIWKKRFKESEVKEANNPHNSSTLTLITNLTRAGLGLSSKTIGYIFAEIKWMNAYKRVQEDVEKAN